MQYETAVSVIIGELEAKEINKYCLNYLPTLKIHQ